MSEQGKVCRECGRKLTLEAEVYTIEEVCTLLKLNRKTVVSMFENEKGVIKIERPEQMHKRRYRTFRIPRAVYERVLRKHSVS